MHLTYSDKCPDSYEPVGFHPETNSSIFIGEVRGPSLADMDTSLHRHVSLDLKCITALLIDTKGMHRCV